MVTSTLANWLGSLARSRGGTARGWALAVLATALLAAPLAAQQTGQVSGTVTGAASGRALAAVAVSIEGTEIRALTNAQGEYVLLGVPVGTHRVIAEVIGYRVGRAEVQVPAGAAVALNFALSVGAVQLEGIVVTGTPTQARRKELGHSIEVITAEEIEMAGAVDIDDVLRGKAPGFQVQGQTGLAGPGSQILIRGLNSIEGRNRPLIYLDGIRMNDRGAYESSGNTSDQAATVLNSINPQDIERIEIIKGAAASTIYGTEASAGVIQIFTKQGAVGRPRWTFAIEQGVAVPRHVGPEMDPTGLHLNDCTFGGPVRPDQTEPDPDCPSSGSWLKNSWQQDYRLDVRGGGSTYSYYAAASFGITEGIVNVPDEFDPQTSEDLNVRANFTFNPFETMQIQLSNSYTRRDIQWIEDGDFWRGFTKNVIKLDEGETPDNRDALVFESDIEQDIDHFNTGVNLNWTPIPGFNHNLRLGLDWSQSQTIRLRPLGNWSDPEGMRMHDTETSRLITLWYGAGWLTDLSDTWTSNFEFGGQFNDREDRGMRVDCSEFVAPGEAVANECQIVDNLQEDRRGFRTGGFFFSERVGWKDRLFITAAVRADAFSQINSELDLDYHFMWYPKLMLTYTVSDHDFWPDLFDTFRVRSAWGESGDPPPQNAMQTLWQIAGADELPESGYIIYSLSQPDIEAERTSEWEFGIDASAYNGRVSAEFNYFWKKTRDGIMYNPLLPSTGVWESVPVNAGTWKTWGYDIKADLTVIDLPNYLLTLRGSYMWYDNEILDLGSLGTQDDDESTANVGFNTRFTEGKPFPQYYGEPIENADELALPVTGETQDLGRSIPNKELSLGLGFTLYNRLTLDMYGTGQFGHLLLDEGAQEAAEDGVWPQCVAVLENLEDHETTGAPLEHTAAWIDRCDDSDNEDWLFSGDYFRIQSASLTYRVPERFMFAGLTGVQLQFRVTNLALFADYPTDTDPDALLGAANFELFRSGGFTVPAPRTYSFTLRVNF